MAINVWTSLGIQAEKGLPSRYLWHGAPWLDGLLETKWVLAPWFVSYNGSFPSYSRSKLMDDDLSRYSIVQIRVHSISPVPQPTLLDTEAYRVHGASNGSKWTSPGWARLPVVGVAMSWHHWEITNQHFWVARARFCRSSKHHGIQVSCPQSYDYGPGW